VGQLLSVNVGQPEPNPYKAVRSTGIGKRPVEGEVEVRAPGAKRGGLGSGLVGDFVGDVRHHGGDSQAVYAFQREDLDAWQERLGRPLSNGFFGENLTTAGIDVNDALVGEVWQVGATVRLRVTSPRLPCATFRGWMGERAWAKTFTADARPGTYLSVAVPGTVRAGDPVEVVHRPGHAVSSALVFRALTTERDLLPQLLVAEDDLEPEIAAMARERRLVVLD
jgi:MOSC domain-containing protein YiiM